MSTNSFQQEVGMMKLDALHEDFFDVWDTTLNPESP
jgi:hypothetical protein